jgi:P4 family phage/plasmid primase-like protien
VKSSPSEFLAALFGAAPAGYQVEVRAVPGTSTWVPADGTGVPELTPGSDWYFGVAPRGAGGKVDVGSLVWVDVDKPPEGFDPDDIRPRPTAVVRSGRQGGIHAYWALNKPIEAGHATRLARLAAMAFGGDPVAAQSAARVQRLPGSLNRKYDPPAPCEAEVLDPDRVYDPFQVEELLLVEVLRKFWSGGERHQLSLGLGALLTRSGEWDRDRIERTVRVLVHRTGDDEGGDRVKAVTSALARRESNLPVAVAPLREALGEEYVKLTDALGLSNRDGELVYDGVVVGYKMHIERDLTNWVIALGEWAWADGVPTRWDGTCWKASSAEELASWVFRKLSAMKEMIDGEELDLVAKGSHARAVCSLVCGFMAQSPLPPPEPYCLPVTNGVVDLRTSELLSHGKEFRNRWVCPVAWEPGSACPTWERFLDEATNDRSEVDFLQEWVGYCLIPGNPWERMVWLFGPSGTGKSTFLGRVANVLGNGCVAVRGEQFDSYTLASIASCRLAVCTELSSRVLKTTTLKALVSGDPIQARHAYGRPFTVQFAGKFMFSTNELPPVDQSVGLWRRLAVFPFERVVSEPDVHLKETLDSEELPGILQWAVLGLRRLEKFDQQGQWPLPESVVEIVAEYREAADTFRQFHHDEMVPDPSYLKPPMPARELYARYTWWCKDRSVSPEPYGPVFWREMRNLGLEPLTEEPPDGSGKRRVRLWRGATLVEPEALSQPPDD